MGARWGWHLDQEDTHAMALGDRSRALHKEAGWSQAELAQRIGVDAGRVSRYESGRITPSADALVRLAESLNISIDHLLIDDIPRRPLHSAEDVLGDRIGALGELADDDLHLVTSFIDALVTKIGLSERIHEPLSTAQSWGLKTGLQGGRRRSPVNRHGGGRDGLGRSGTSEAGDAPVSLPHRARITPRRQDELNAT